MKKFYLSFLLCLTALMAVADCTVYYAGSLTNVYAYAWNAGGEMAWPGQPMTQTTFTYNGKAIWTITFNTDYSKIIFSSKGSAQTADLFCSCGQLFAADCEQWVDYSGTGDATNNDCMPDPEGIVGVPAEYEGVMLQAFYWDSYRLTKYSSTKWAVLSSMASDMAQTFDLIWLPPSGNGGGVGYYTKTYSNQDSDWGTKAALKSLIGQFHSYGSHAIADIVINHRQSSAGWAKSFTNEDFGEYGSFQITSEHICSGDEAKTNSSSDSKSLTYGNADTGDNDGGCRDLDHTNTYVQDYCKAYLNWMKDEMEYDGWRYDMVKGYSGKYVSMYNISSQPYFSVGEYWDGSANNLKSYLNAARYNTAVFDFDLKYKFNSFGKSGGFSSLKNAGMRGIGLQKYAVTFIDNHDTFERSDNQGDEFVGYNVNLAANKTRIIQANAYLLMMPGTPCVFWPHWYTFQTDIKQLVRLRKAVGIHSESTVSAETASTTVYEATIQGHNGSAILRMGTQRETAVPNGYFLAITGPNFEIYASDGVSFTPAVITDIQQSQAPTQQAVKTLINGRLCIEVNGQRYDVMGRQIDDAR